MLECNCERVVAHVVGQRHARASLDEQRGRLGVASLGRQVQWRLLHLIKRIDLRSGLFNDLQI